MSLGLGGCYSQIPMAVSHKQTTQRKMQAAHHWDVLASDTADRVEQAMDDRDDLRNRPIFIRPAGETSFSKGFHELLTSQLVSRGLQVSIEEEDVLYLDYRVLLVRHSERFQRPPVGTFTALPLGITAAAVINNANAWADGAAVWAWGAAGVAAGVLLDLASGYFADYSAHEVVITSALSFRNRYVSHSSTIYYINDPDWCHYAEVFEESGPQPGFGGRSLRVVNE